MVDACGSHDVTFGSTSSAPSSIWQNFQAHPQNQEQQGVEEEGHQFEAWQEANDGALKDDGLHFDGADDLQNSILWASIKKSGFSFLDVLCHDDACSLSKDPEIISVRKQTEAASDTDVGRELTSLCIKVVGQLREQRIDAANETVLQHHALNHHTHASAYFQGEIALFTGQLDFAREKFKFALAAALPHALFIYCHIGLAAALRGLAQDTESTNQLRFVLKMFPHDCDLLLACAQHVLLLGRSKDEAEALLQCDAALRFPHCVFVTL
jgi:hypothetical protein